MGIDDYKEVEDSRIFDPAKNVGGCDGLFKPTGGSGFSMHQDKTMQDKLPTDKRPRVEEAKARRKAMKKA